MAHQLLALLVGQGVPVVLLAPALGHRVEAEGPHVGRRQHREEPVVDHLLGHTRGVLAHFGHRDVGLGHGEAGRLNLGLELAQIPEVLAEHHETGVGLGAHDGRRHDLEAGLDGLGHGRSHGLAVDGAGRVAEEVDDVQALRGTERLGVRHGFILRGDLRAWSGEKLTTPRGRVPAACQRECEAT